MTLIGITLLFMVADVVSGIAKAVKEENLSSKKAREGMWHKAGFIGLIVLSELLELATKFSLLTFDVPALAIICSFIIFSESLSIFENLVAINPEIAKSPLANLLETTKQLGNKDEQAQL